APRETGRGDAIVAHAPGRGKRAFRCRKSGCRSGGSLAECGGCARVSAARPLRRASSMNLAAKGRTKMLGRISLRPSLTLLSAAAALLIATSARAAYAPVAAPLVLEQYVIVHDALASDNTEGVAAAIDLMRTLVAKRIALAGDDERPLFEAVDRAAARFV